MKTPNDSFTADIVEILRNLDHANSLLRKANWSIVAMLLSSILQIISCKGGLVISENGPIWPMIAAFSIWLASFLLSITFFILATIKDEII